MHARTHALTHARTHACTLARARTHTHTHTHIHTHTHTHRGTRTHEHSDYTKWRVMRENWRMYQNLSGEYGRVCKVEDSHRDKTEQRPWYIYSREWQQLKRFHSTQGPLYLGRLSSSKALDAESTSLRLAEGRREEVRPLLTEIRTHQGSETKQRT